MAYQGIVEQLGGYYGEVLVRTHEGAEWTDSEEFGWVVTVGGPDGEVVSNVFHIAADCLREPSKFAIGYDNVVEHAGLDAPPVAGDGDHVTIAVQVPDGDASPAEFREAADRLVEDYAWRDLDYSPDSLAELDAVVVEEIFDGELLVDRFGEEELSATVRKLGSYFGRTLVEAHDGEWVYEDDAWTVRVDRGEEVVAVDAFRTALSVLHEDATFADAYDRATGGRTLQSMAADRAGAFVADWPGYGLDFSTDSLEDLDRLASEEFGEFEGVEDPTDRLREVATGFGTYFGEVLRREDGAVWVEDDGPAIFVEGDEEAVGVGTVQVAMTCLAGNATFVDTREELLSELA